MAEGFRRKTPEEILLSIAKLHRGRLKIVIGAVSGSGKTYHMLREGRLLKEQGIDVVLCAVSTMSRPETVEQIGDLERVPSIHWMRDEVEQKDLNLDALLQRNPEVVLVDDLAHVNQEGARFPNRLQDIRFLLGQGISVITTVNVYELEGAAELAQQWTGFVAECLVPAGTLEQADEVRLIDVTPETILKRIEEGSVKQRLDAPLLQRGNIGKLRELALRLVAEDVSGSLERYRDERGLSGPTGTAERILVAAQYHWNGSIYVLRGHQMAKRLSGDMLVAAFADPGKPLTKEAAAFKRSLAKLTDKLGASFAELPFPGRRQMPGALVRYAMEQKATRIVIGHSKQSVLQDLRHGSIVNRLLNKARHIDVYLVADRTEQEGERILPTRTGQASIAPEEAVYRRLSEKEVSARIETIRRGKLKVYIGAAPGVGKTYTMLREGNDLLRKKIDVVIGLLETHGRAETLAQVAALETVPRAFTEYRGANLEEMDVRGIIARNPEVVLVDELAHTNVPGSRNRKRYEDVAELLDAGISVISTMNVQHLESLNDAVEQITGVRVRETVPDSVLRMASEVELIDVAPKSLQARMREGKIYAMEKVDQALSHFFQTGNLIALRELALREIADDVDERLEAWERTDSLRGPWRKKEAIFVGVTLGADAERLIRRGFRIAYRLKARWLVAYVQDRADMSSEAACKRLKCLRELTERLGGEFEAHPSVSRRRVPHMLLARANELQATQIIVSESRQTWRERLRSGSVVRTLLRHGRNMDVLVVAGFDREAAGFSHWGES